MKIKKLVLVALATLIASPLANAAAPSDRMDQRIKYRSCLSCEAVMGPCCFNEGWIESNFKDDTDYGDKKVFTRALSRITAMQCDVLRDVASDWKFPEITSKAYVEKITSELPSEDSEAIIINQKNDPSLNGKSAQQVAHDIQASTGKKAAALVCANAQYRLGRVFDSTSQEEGAAQASVNLIKYMTGAHFELETYYNNGRASASVYNPFNCLVVNNVTFFTDECLPAVSGFRCGVRDGLKEDPTRLSLGDTMQVNLLFHAAADKDQVTLENLEAKFEEEFEHIFRVCDKEKIKYIVLSKFGTGSFAKNREAAEAAWNIALSRVFERVGKKLGINVIVADGAPSKKNSETNNEVIKKQKSIAINMLGKIGRKSYLPFVTALDTDSDFWGI